MNIITANILTALESTAIGTRVTAHDEFLAVLRQAVAEHDFSSDPVPGQGFLMIEAAVPFVSAGVGQRTANPSDYLVRCHRGRVDAYLDRSHAAQVTGCAAIVYTRDAYLADPDVQEDLPERSRVVSAEATHILVAVLAFAGPKSPYSPYRFVANLAGSNREALLWDAETIRAKAKEVQAYDDEWCVVAD